MFGRNFSQICCGLYGIPGKDKKHLAFCNGGKGLEQLTMIVDLKVESSLCQNLAVFGGKYSFLGPTTDGLI